MDFEKQKDELTALESIYNDEEFSYHLQKNENNEFYEVTLKIFIPLPENYFFTYKDNRKPDEEVQKVNISYLPPLTLIIQLPEDYPSISSPRFTLRSSWLRYADIAKLCKELDHLWEINKGQEILFTWIGFLQTEVLEFLKIQESISIDHSYTFYKALLENAQNVQEKSTEGEVKNSAVLNKKLKVKRNYRKARNKKFYDKRAIPDILVGRNPVQLLIDYNENRKEIEFMRNCYSCMICFSDKLGKQCTKFSPCDHVFCKECIISYLEVKIKEGSVQNILCPEVDCKSEATPGQIKDLLTPELFSKYDSMLLNSVLDTMTDIIYCPRRGCQYPVSREPNEVMATCPVCQYAFCIYCKMVYHGIEPCKVNTGEKQKLVKQYQDASEDEKKQLELRYGKRQLQLLVENTMSENWITTNSQNCPKCDAAIEKSDGCNKMTCRKCNTFFCWVCKAKLNHDDPYDHYRNTNSQCFNKLYLGAIPDEDDEDDFEENYFYSSDEDDEIDENFDDEQLYLNFIHNI